MTAGAAAQPRQLIVGWKTEALAAAQTAMAMPHFPDRDLADGCIVALDPYNTARPARGFAIARAWDSPRFGFVTLLAPGSPHRARVQVRRDPRKKWRPVMSATNDARDGGRLDFQEVYAEFHLRIQRYLARLLGPNEAEDAAQEVFAKVSRALAEFRADSSLSTWIYRIATNTAYDKLRSPSFKRSDEVPIDDATPVEEPSAGIDETLVQTEMNDCIGEYVDRLPASYRSVVVLSEHEGLTNQEIAETLNVSVDTVKIRLHRARARLKKELGNGCDFYRDGRNEFACQPKPDSPLRLGDPLVPRVAVPDHAHAATSSGREPGRHDEQPEADQHPGHREDPPGRTPQ